MHNDIPDTYKIRELQERIMQLERDNANRRDMEQAHQQEWRDMLATLQMHSASMRKEKQALEQLVKDAATLLQEVPMLSSKATGVRAWLDQRTALLKRIEQEGK